MGKIIVKFSKVLISLVLLINFSFIFASYALAGAPSFGQGLLNTGTAVGYKTDKANLSLSEKIGRVIFVATAFVGVIFFGLVIYAGYTWLLARGNEQEVTKAKNIITYAVIGMVAVLSAYAITMFISTLWKSSIPTV